MLRSNFVCFSAFCDVGVTVSILYWHHIWELKGLSLNSKDDSHELSVVTKGDRLTLNPVVHSFKWITLSTG